MALDLNLHFANHSGQFNIPFVLVSFFFRVDLKMKEFTVFGFKQTDYMPVMVKSILETTVDSSLLDIKFEMNPLDKQCDQRVDVNACPLQIVYDAETIIQLLQVFKLPSNANLSE